MTGFDFTVLRPAPTPGEHTDAVLQELGEEGMHAINAHFTEKYEAAQAEAEAKALKEGLNAEQAAAKN